MVIGRRLPVKQGISSPAVTSIPEQWDRQWFRNFITNFMVNADIRNIQQGSGITISGNVSGNNTTGTSNNTSVTISQSPIANDTVLGNVSGNTAVPIGLNSAQLTALLNPFSATLQGAVPFSGGGTINYLRADGTWNAPPGTTSLPGGANTQVQYNNAGVFAGSSGLTWSGTTLSVTGTAQATTFNATSDPKLKKGLKVIGNSGHIIDALHGYKFKWKDSDRHDLGVISTEVKKITPELVTKTEAGHDSVNYNGLVAVLIEEVRILRERVAKLEEKNAE